MSLCFDVLFHLRNLHHLPRCMCRCCLSSLISLSRCVYVYRVTSIVSFVLYMSLLGGLCICRCVLFVSCAVLCLFNLASIMSMCRCDGGLCGLFHLRHLCYLCRSLVVFRYMLFVSFT